MWEEAREVVKNVFFKDMIDIYEVGTTTNDIGEEIDKEVLIYPSVPCNIEQNSLTGKQEVVSVSFPEVLRISMPKQYFVSKNAFYKVKIRSARINFDANRFLNVDSQVEGQISTVLIVSYEVRV